MNRKKREIDEAISKALDEQGVIDYSFEIGGRHPFVSIRVMPGRVRKYYYPGTLSDGRSIQNTVAGIRRLIREEKEKCRAM